MYEKLVLLKLHKAQPKKKSFARNGRGVNGIKENEPRY